MTNEQKYYVDTTTKAEWLLRIGIVVAAAASYLGFVSASVFGWPLLFFTATLILIGVAWCDQYEISSTEGIVLLRSFFGKELSRRVVLSPSEIGQVTTKSQKVLVKGTFFYQVRFYHIPIVRSQKGKEYPIGPAFPLMTVVMEPGQRDKLASTPSS